MIIATPTFHFDRGMRKTYTPLLSGLGDGVADLYPNPLNITTPQQAVSVMASYADALNESQMDLQELASAAAADASTQAAIGAQMVAAQSQYSSLVQQINQLNSFWESVAYNLNPIGSLAQYAQTMNLASQIQALQNQIAQMQAEVSSLNTAGSVIASGSATTYSAMAAEAQANGDPTTAAYYQALAASAQQAAVNISAAAATADSAASGGILNDLENWFSSIFSGSGASSTTSSLLLWGGIALAAVLIVPPLIKKL